MVKRLFFLLSFLLSFPFFGAAQYDAAYRQKFDMIRDHLGSGRTGKAFLLLEGLYALDSTNHYTNYLMGVCYTEQYIITEASIKHLEYAVKDVMEIYSYIPYNETRAPVYAWYYLTKAYSQNGYCDKARWAMQRFFEEYGSLQNDYFVVNIRKFLEHCRDRTWAKAHPSGKDIVTKDVRYSTQRPLYGLQVGAFKELVPVREEFDDLKNVEAFMDRDGMLRYVIGHFGFRKQAESLLKVVKEAGYSDAFIVNVNEERKFSNEIVIVDNISFKANIRGRVEFRVQVGAFTDTDSIPPELARLYLKLDEIKEEPENGLTVLTVGNFKTYETADFFKETLLDLGVPGAFVVAYNQGHKISIKAAQKYIERKEREDKG